MSTKTSKLIDSGTSWVSPNADYAVAKTVDTNSRVSTEVQVSVGARASTTKREGTVTVRTVPRPPSRAKSSDTK